jgi:hypothetical protein
MTIPALLPICIIRLGSSGGVVVWTRNGERHNKRKEWTTDWSPIGPRLSNW